MILAKKKIISDNVMILMSSFVSNRVACSVIQRFHKEKPTVSENLRPNAVTALLSDFHLAGVG